MADWKPRKHTWPRRGATERRVHARVRVSFPISLEPDESETRFEGLATDLGLGGVRVELDRHLDLFSSLHLSMDLPVTNREGVAEMHTISAAAAVVRIEPDDASAEGPFEASLSFSKPAPEIERVLATFMLQSLLFDPSAELV